MKTEDSEEWGPNKFYDSMAAGKDADVTISAKKLSAMKNRIKSLEEVVKRYARSTEESVDGMPMKSEDKIEEIRGRLDMENLRKRYWRLKGILFENLSKETFLKLHNLEAKAIEEKAE